MEKIHDEVKKTLLKNLGNTPLKYFANMNSMCFELVAIATRTSLEDVSIEMWKAVKNCYSKLRDGNTEINEISVEICNKILEIAN